MANSQAVCSSFKQELMRGSHALYTQDANGTRTVTTKDVVKAALYLTSASMGASSTAYTSSGELAATGNYTAGGATVTTGNDIGLTSTTAYFTPSASIVWSNLTSSGLFDAVLLYNDSSTGKLAISVHTFGTQQVTAGEFTITMPTHDSSTGLIRLA